MRSINLIPEDELRGERAPTRTGPTAYIIVAVLAAVVLGVTGMALAGKSITDKQAKVDRLEQEEAQTTAAAEQLRPFAEFRSMQEARTATVASLAQSRFDWERVMNELSLVLPSDIWLTNLTGTVRPDVTVTNGAGLSLRGSIEGPALELVGCGAGQDSVAGFVAALEDIDGVTRVGLASSKLPDDQAAAASPGGDGEDCRTRNFIAQFEIVVAFDAVPIPAAAGQVPVTPLPGTPTADSQLASESPAVPGGS